MIRAEFDGAPAPDLVIAKTTLEFRGDRCVIRFDGEIADEGRFGGVHGTTALSLSFTGEAGSNQGRIIPAIYQLAGDRLRICFGFGGIAPTAFATAAGTQLYLATYTRL